MDDSATTSLLGGRRATVLAIALVVGVVAAVTLSWRAKLIHLAATHREQDARALAERVHEDVASSLEGYGHALYAMRAYLRASEHVRQDEWKRFVHESRMELTHPGVYGFAYIKRVEPGGAGALEARMRDGGAEGFRVRDPSDDGPMYVVTYEEPEDRNRLALGYNAASNPANKMVYDEAARSGEIRVSQPFRLAQQEGERPGVVMALAHYHAGAPIDTPGAREDAVVGWVGVALDLEHFLAAEGWEGVSLAMGTAGVGPERDLATRPGEREMVDPATYRFLIEIGGRTMVLRVGVDRAQMTSAFDGYASSAVAVGAVVALALGVIVWLVSRSREHAHAMAARMTERLRAREVELRELALRAESANRAKSMFLANMSHEIRTPMTSILGFTDVIAEQLREERDPATMELAIGRIQSSGQHLLQIINDILDITRIESGKLELRPAPVSVREVVEEVATSLRGGVAGGGVELRAEIGEGVPATVLADGYRLRQILLNLTGNALKFTARGSVVVRARWVEGVLRVEVEDTGIGIAPAELERLFRPFAQVDGSTVRRHQGTGLGLAISRSLAEGMGGTLSATSEPGRGSVFRLELPAPRVYARAVEPAAPAAGVPARLSGRVLVAEDGEDNRRLIEHFLARAGLDVTLVPNGREAVDAALAGSFDLVILDMQMPVLDGYGAARELRASGYRGPILALTAHAMEGDDRACLDAGCDAYQRKPIDRAALLREIASRVPPARAA